MLQVELVSPEEVLYSGEAYMVIVRTLGGGEVAFLPGHAPFLGALDVGYEAKIQKQDGGPFQSLKVNGGFVEVSNDKVTILSDEAEAPEED
jgi:F-type H+-transporting ATPase subunit epsilon